MRGLAAAAGAGEEGVKNEVFLSDEDLHLPNGRGFLLHLLLCGIASARLLTRAGG